MMFLHRQTFPVWHEAGWQTRHDEPTLSVAAARRTLRILRCACVLLVAVWSIGFIFLTQLDAPQTPSPAATEPPPKKNRPMTVDESVDKSNLCDRLERGLVDRQVLNATVLDACRRWTDAQRDYFSARPYRVNWFRRRLVKTGDGVCSNRTFMVIVVHSLHTYDDRRAAIRETWGGAAVSGLWPAALAATGVELPEVRLVFMFGRLTKVAGAEEALSAESEQFGDIGQGDFDENYRNMTLKSLTGLDWVIQYCPAAKFLFKCDDDMFVNVPAIIDAARSEDLRRAIMGPFNVGSRVYRKGKWALKPTEYPFYYFPPYESGSGYLIGVDLLRPLRHASDFVPYIFVDDVYITGILGRVVGARHVTRPGFAFWTNRAPSACSIVDGNVMTGTRVTPSLQREIWANLNVNHVNCSNSSVPSPPQKKKNSNPS